MNGGLAVLQLLRLASPGLPIGAYSYSQGLESALDLGLVRDADSARLWLHDVLHGRRQVRMLMCGHIHRAFSGVFAGHSICAAPATSIQLTLDLTEVDMHRPDGREILVEEPPGFALLMAHEGRLTTHTCQAGAFKPAVTYNFPFRTKA